MQPANCLSTPLPFSSQRPASVVVSALPRTHRSSSLILRPPPVVTLPFLTIDRGRHSFPANITFFYSCCLTFLLTRYFQEPLFEQGTFIAAAQEYSSPSFGLSIATPDSYSPTDLDGSHHQPTSNAYIISIPIWQSSDHPKLLSSHSENIFLCLRSSYDSGARPPLSIQALHTTSRIRPTSLRRT